MDFEYQLTRAYQLVDSEQLKIQQQSQKNDFLHLIIKDELNLQSIQHHQAAFYEINITNQLILEQLWIVLDQFFAKGNTRIAITLIDEQSSWQQQASFIYHLLKVIDTHYCELLLIDFGPQIFSGLFSGAVTAFAHESQRVKMCRVTAQNTEIFAVLSSLFEQCYFEIPSQHYHLKHQLLVRSQWQPVVPIASGSKSFSGNVLITGGSGAIGQLLAHHLHHQHHCQVFLVGRKPLSPELAAKLKHLKVKAYFQADCTQLEEIREIYQYINEHYGSIEHIFHLAGSLNDSLFINKQLDDFLNTIAVKVVGAQVIAKLAEQFKPKSIFLFSSLSGVTGNAGQTDYAAANASLNELAEKNNSQNQTQWFAINWGLWETTSGMQMSDSSMMNAMQSEDALRLLDLIYANNLSLTTVYNGSYELLKTEHKLEEEQSFSLAPQISIINARKKLKEIIIECTKIKNLDEDTSLLEKGVDSIIATHIAIHIEKELSQLGAVCKIPKTLIFQYATFNQIFDYLLEHHANALHSVFPSHLAQENKLIEAPLKSVTKPAEQSNEEERFAIIAAAGEFPEALDLHDFWELMKEGKHAIKAIPEERWDWQQQFSLDANEKGKSYCRHGGFLQEAALFDNSYFKITPRDAQKMTPEARRLLHQSYHALEQCNFLKTLEGNVAVFVANMYAHYQNLNKENELVDSSLSAMANHISYAFKFNGPSMGIDSMCSGGLSALHVALNSLKLNDCKAVLVGAANIMSHPGKYRFLSEGKFLSPSGKCQSFGIGADGYVPGEGCVVLIIKRYKDAVENKDKILGIIRGSAVNSNGANGAMTVPSAKAQAQVIKKALLKSALTPEDISYIETHGTGTSLGDPIEIDGLNQVYGQNNQAIAIGSLKSNIGHLEAAAGLASIIKVLLQMHYRMKVPSLHCDIENPLLGLDKTSFELQKKLVPWGADHEVLYAGVSAFGAGGANAHVILESPPPEYAYSHIPKAGKGLAPGQAFWIEPYLAVPIVSNSKWVEMDKTRSIWLTKKIEACESPVMRSDSQKTSYFFIVTANQKRVLALVENVQSVILLHEAVSILHEALKQQPKQKFVVINLTALDENEEDSHLSDHFNFAQSLADKNINLDLILVNRLNFLSLSLSYRAAFDGLYRTLSLENPNIKTLVIQSDESLTQIVELLQTSRIKEDVLNTYLRIDGQWKKQQFSENDELLRQQHSPLLKEGGVYVISGGLGALGQIISNYLLSQYNARVICLGRSSLIGVKAEQFNQLQSINAKCDYYQVDITDGLKVQETIRAILHKYGTLNGIINSACVLKDGLLSEKSFAVFAEVTKSKIQGTINLDEATKDCTLDFFVSFSSMSAIYSNVGQSDYCMANTFVDYFTDYRERLVKNARRFGKSISINWPLWEVDGLSLSPQAIEYLCEATGIEPLNEQEGAKLFELLMDRKHPSQIVPLHGNKIDIRAKLLAQKVSEVIAERSLDGFIHSVIDCISQVTHLDPSGLTSETSINELGMSSVLLTELAGLLEKQLGTSIAPSAFFSYNTVGKIVHYLNQKIPQKQQAKEVIDLLISEKKDEFAIIGLSAMLPGGPEPEAFWQTLINNQSTVKKVARWQGEYFAATLDNIKQFDNQFFNLSNREAMLMDPQHRLFLQQSYLALLDAGYPPTKMKEVGVFAGVQFNDYQNLLSQHKIPQHPYMATGNSHAMLANRVSYLFDFNGPSQTIDTACSSTLIAINRGILALKNKECDLALCGAVSLLIDSGVTEAANSMGVLSPNFRCATFDEQADGYVRGEGVGVFVIKRLGDALRDKDAIHAVIASCAENHGGRANSLTAPNPIAQKGLLIKAYNSLLASQVSYIETHGTGTRLGDPVEIDALTQAFNELLPEANKNTILLGSVKTNVGHLEPAAGVASMIKVIYALKQKIIPANLHFNQLNSYINLQNSPFKIADKNTPWEAKEYVAGISSFGFGGSYAHLVLREAPALTPQIISRAEFYFPVSARKKDLLHAMKTQLIYFLEKEKNLPVDALSYMLCCRREHFNHRLIFKASSIDELISDLRKDQEEASSSDPVIRAYHEGKEMNWEQYFPEQPTKIHIPGYVFEPKEFWFDASSMESVRELEHV